jgi:ubiquinone/menaquinone biosynthesis C-methylase UbiE
MIDYDKIASEYAEHREVHPEVLKHLIVDGRISASSRILDVGCGTGNYVTTLWDITGATSWGIDPSEEMLNLAKKRVEAVEFYVGHSGDFPFEREALDLVFSVDVVHHIGNRRAYFAEATRVLKPNGLLCTVTDSEGIIRRRSPLSVYFPESVAIELDRYPRISVLGKEMESAGFTEIRSELVEFPYELNNIQAYRDKAFSALHLISEKEFQRGIERMEHDLKSGPIVCNSRYVLLWGTKES